MKLLVIDNFDSFTYNLVQYFGELGAELQVVRNNAMTLAEIGSGGYDGIVLSPGPGNPDTAGITLSVIQEFSGCLPIFGVCLGLQSIAQAFGGQIVRAEKLMHGKTSQILHDAAGIFSGLPNPFIATRYHSLVAEPASIPECLQVTAQTKDHVIMGLEHREFPVFGVQFHPESVLTDCGRQLLQNFLNIIDERKPL